MTRKPRVAGVPDWLIDAWLALLEDGCMAPETQRQLHKLLVHKWSGKPGVLDCGKIMGTLQGPPG